MVRSKQVRAVLLNPLVVANALNIARVILEFFMK
jgi:hypothetical protein